MAMIISYFVLKYADGRYLKARCFPVPVRCATVAEAQQYVGGDLAGAAANFVYTYDAETPRELPKVYAVGRDGTEQLYPA